MQPVPNLFRTWDDPRLIERYYCLYLAELHAAQRAHRLVEVCRSIRRFAKKHGEPKAGLFTFQYEMYACEGIGDAEAGWRLLRTWDRAALGKTIDLASHRWNADDAHRLMFFYSPLLYLRGHYRLGCQLLENALKMHSHQKGWSFELLWHVYKPLLQPSTTYDVTLTHFYRALGRELRDWPLWRKFVDDFPSKLFQLSGVSRNSLRNDPTLLKPFFQWICAERERRLFTHTTMGAVDLLESAAKVKHRQINVATKIARLANNPHRLLLEEKLKKRFPELAEIRAND
jgi:hypothetical protein